MKIKNTLIGICIIILISLTSINVRGLTQEEQQIIDNTVKEVIKQGLPALISDSLNTVEQSINNNQIEVAKKKIRNIEEVIRQAKKFGVTDTFKTRLDPLKKRAGYTIFDSWWGILSSKNTYNPTEHPIIGASSLVVALAIFLFIRTIRRRKVLESTSELAHAALKIKKVSHLFGEISHYIKEKGDYIKRNEEYMSKLNGMLARGELQAPELSRLYERGSIELTKNWAKDIKSNIINKNKKILDRIKRVQQFVEKQLPAEQKDLLKSLEDDAKKIKSIEHKYKVVNGEIVGSGNKSVSEIRQNFVLSLKEIYAKDVEINKTLKDKILPYQVYIYNYIKDIYISIVNEEGSVEAEAGILEALSTKRVAGLKLKGAVENLIAYNKRKVLYYEMQVKKQAEFLKLLYKEDQLTKWMRFMELSQESKLKITIEDADRMLRKETKTDGLFKKRDGKPLKLIRVMEKKYDKEVPKQIWTLTELYDIVGPEYIGNDAFRPLLIREADEGGAEEKLKKAEEDRDKLAKEIRTLERRLKHTRMPAEAGKIIIPGKDIAVVREEIDEKAEDDLETKKAELEKKDKEIEKAKIDAEAIKHRNYPKSELNDIGEWFVREWDHLGEEHRNVIGPLGTIIGKLGPDKVEENRIKIKDYLEKYFPHVKQ